MSKLFRIVTITLVLVAVVAALWWFVPRDSAPDATQPQQAKIDVQAVNTQYVRMAHAIYSDSLNAAQALQDAVGQFIDSPSAESLTAARTAWRAARVPYMQTEVFRFSNPPVDAWEGQVNAWPLDEGLIDYVAEGYVYEQGNNAAQANIIANPKLQIGSREIDTTDLTPQGLADINEISGSEANVATGYHAIEFLLWGQDLNGTGPGAGERPYTDYVTNAEDCTDGKTSAPVTHCQRRAEYLQAVTQLLVTDLETMVAEWAPDSDDNYRATFINKLPEGEALRRILFGVGSLTLGELAGERTRVALIAHSTEDEHDCFSDNTHNSHYYDTLGIANLYHGEYQRLDGSIVSGASIEDMLQAQDAEAAEQFNQALENTLAKFKALVDSAESGEHFDQLIAPGNTQGNQLVQAAIDSLVALAGQIESMSAKIGVTSLQPDNAGHEF